MFSFQFRNAGRPCVSAQQPGDEWEPENDRHELAVMMEVTGLEPKLSSSPFASDCSFHEKAPQLLSYLREVLESTAPGKNTHWFPSRGTSSGPSAVESRSRAAVGSVGLAATEQSLIRV